VGSNKNPPDPIKAKGGLFLHHVIIALENYPFVKFRAPHSAKMSTILEAYRAFSRRRQYKVSLQQ
jgi:hypothetical protein